MTDKAFLKYVGWPLLVFLIIGLMQSAHGQTTQRSYHDAMGRNVGRSTTDTQGNTTFYDAMGRNTGRATTDSRGNTTVYDNMGRSTGRSVTNGNTTTTYDNMGRQTSTITKGR